MENRLYLLPNLLTEEADVNFLPAVLPTIMQNLQGLIAESEKGARRYLKIFLKGKNLPIKILSEHTKKEDFSSFLDPLLKGENWGIISDAGLPCLADPGSALVFMAREQGIKIEALAGPSSIIMALMLSGFPAQVFTFNGYLPREEKELRTKVLCLEKQAFLEKKTQIWIETPYRVKSHLEILLKTLNDNTLLCLAMNLTSLHERVLGKRIREWKKEKVEIGKELCVFLLGV
jgi:16S rRNA (cytidine1402-2'-O)-methyltransferase